MDALPCRKSIRKPFHDYATPAYYFVTICIHQKRHLLGNICQGRMFLNHAGEMVSNIWQQIPQHNPGVQLHAFVVMPNHFHGILQIVEIHDQEPTTPETDSNPYGKTLGLMVGSFKAITTKFYSQGVGEQRWPSYNKHLWQRGFHDHIIRDKSKFDQLVVYISENPRLWHDDCYFS